MKKFVALISLLFLTIVAPSSATTYMTKVYWGENEGKWDTNYRLYIDCYRWTYIGPSGCTAYPTGDAYIWTISYYNDDGECNPQKYTYEWEVLSCYLPPYVDNSYYVRSVTFPNGVVCAELEPCTIEGAPTNPQEKSGGGCPPSR